MFARRVLVAIAVVVPLLAALRRCPVRTRPSPPWRPSPRPAVRRVPPCIRAASFSPREVTPGATWSRDRPARPAGTPTPAGGRPARVQRDRRHPGGHHPARQLRRGQRLHHRDAAGEREGAALDHHAGQFGPEVPHRVRQPRHQLAVRGPPPRLRRRLLERSVHGVGPGLHRRRPGSQRSPRWPASRHLPVAIPRGPFR